MSTHKREPIAVVESIALANPSSPIKAPLYFERSTDTPLASISVMLQGGTAADPSDAAGCAYHLGELAIRGAASLVRAQIDNELDRMGSGISVVTARDYLGYSVICLSRHLSQIVELLVSVLGSPRFDPSEHQKLIRETRSDLTCLRDNDNELVSRFFASHFCPGHPHARPIEGTQQSLDTLAKRKPEELKALFDKLATRGGAAIGISGHVNRSQAIEYGSKIIDALSPLRPITIEDDSGKGPRGVRVVLVDKPNRSQSQILMGHRAPYFASPDGTALMLAEAALGGMFSSRLMQEIRVKRGWSYDVAMSLARTKIPSWVRISLAPTADTTAQAIALAIELYGEFIEHGLTAKELALASRFTINNMLLSQATARARVAQHTASFVHNVPPDYLANASTMFAELNLAQVNAAIAKHLSIEDLTIVVVGGSQLAAELEQFGPVEIVDYRSL